MAETAFKAAKLLRRDEFHRDAASRAYYSAYFAATSLLHHCGLKPPSKNEVNQQGEAWGHKPTPKLLEQHASSFIKRKDKRKKLKTTLQVMYKARCDADYTTSVIELGSVNRMIREAGFILKVAKDVSNN